MTADLLWSAVMSGLLLGGFYAALSIGLTVTFGLLDVPMVAHPSFIIASAYGVVLLGNKGVPILAAVAILLPVLFLVGWGLYRFYHWSFESRGSDTANRGIAFFFGIAFIVEISISLSIGVDTQMIETPLSGKALEIAGTRLPYRLLVAAVCALAMAGLIGWYLAKTFTGRAIRAVAQDAMAVHMIGADPVRVRQIAFAIGMTTTAIAGALLLVVGPIEPSMGRQFLGKAFAICVLAGMGSVRGTILGALLLGVVESVVLTTAGTSWAPAVAFGMLLVMLAVRPSGLFGR